MSLTVLSIIIVNKLSMLKWNKVNGDVIISKSIDDPFLARMSPFQRRKMTKIGYHLSFSCQKNEL